jgi:hypothetical protein
MALAQATQRSFTMLWKPSAACGSSFESLFENRWNVSQDVPFDEQHAYDFSHYAWNHFPDLTQASETNVYVRHFGWLYQHTRYPHHAPIEAAAKQLMCELTLIPPLQERVQDFRRACFRPTMLGVHYRRGDLMRWRPDTTNNLNMAVEAIDRILAEHPDAGILVCTDDGAPNPYTRQAVPSQRVLSHMQARYGNRVVSTGAQTVRDSETAIQDAVVDLFLLRSTDFFIGTLGSTFSEVAAFGRMIPVIFAAGATDSYARREHVLKRLGLLGWLKQAAHREYGKDVPYPFLFLKYRHRVRRMIQTKTVRKKQ